MTATTVKDTTVVVCQECQDVPASDTVLAYELLGIPQGGANPPHSSTHPWLAGQPSQVITGTYEPMRTTGIAAVGRNAMNMNDMQCIICKYMGGAQYIIWCKSLRFIGCDTPPTAGDQLRPFLFWFLNPGHLASQTIVKMTSFCHMRQELNEREGGGYSSRGPCVQNQHSLVTLVRRVFPLAKQGSSNGVNVTALMTRHLWPLPILVKQSALVPNGRP